MPKSDPVIWRYVTPQKFESMLEHKALYFSAVDLLDDPYEGSISQLEFDERERVCTQPVINASKSTSKSFFPLCVMVNCWFRSERESKAMWDLYGKGSADALCVRSSLGRLTNECDRRARLFYLKKVRQEVVECNASPTISVHEIWYYNPHSKKAADGRNLDWLERKYTRKADWFRWENEVRALFMYTGPDLYDQIKSPRRESPLKRLNRPDEQQLLGSRQYSEFHSARKNARNFTGLFLKVDLPNLITEVVLAPNASHKRQANIRELIKKWGFDIDVRYSDIDVPPRF